MIKRAAYAIVLIALGASNAMALNARTWISGTGVDQAGCGPIANPCRTLQYAHDNTSAGGEIDVKDSAGYGSIVITKKISIVGDSSLAGVLATSGGNAITVTAGPSDVIKLRGLSIDGSGTGANGIVFNSGGGLDVVSCTIQNFAVRSGSSGHGVLLQPASGTPFILIKDTVSSHNGNYGIAYHPTAGSTASALITIDGATLADNRGGFAIDAPVTSGATRVSIANTNAPRNINDGFYIFDSRAIVSFDATSADLNGRHGFIFDNGSVTIGRSRAAHNVGYGLQSSVVVSTFKNNQFNANATGQTDANFSTAPLN